MNILRRIEFLTLILANIFGFCSAKLTVIGIELRTPINNDIGLYFDVKIENSMKDENVTLDLAIRGKSCCIETGNADEHLCEGVPNIIGGNFGVIYPGELMTIGVVWPTTVLLNQKGYCNIIVFTNSNNTELEKELEHTLEFNTTLSPENSVTKEYLKNENVTPCETLDLNPLENCVKINCEVKYFGQRNFWDTSKNICVSVPRCDNQEQAYSYEWNQCTNIKGMFTTEDFDALDNGDYEEIDIENDDNDDDTKTVDSPNTYSNPVVKHKLKIPSIMDIIIVGVLSIIIYVILSLLIFLLVRKFAAK